MVLSYLIALSLQRIAETIVNSTIFECEFEDVVQQIDITYDDMTDICLISSRHDLHSEQFAPHNRKKYSMEARFELEYLRSRGGEDRSDDRDLVEILGALLGNCCRS